MSAAVHSSLLAALVEYYRRLEADPDQPIAEFGFSREKIHFCIVLEPDGALADPGLIDVQQPDAKGRPRPAMIVVPDAGGRSGTAMKPFFCWDNTGYALGRDNKDNPQRGKKMFAAFRDFHLGMAQQVGDDEGYAGLCAFLKQWDPARAEELPGWEEAAGKNVVFRLRRREGYIHQSEVVQRAWRASLKSEDPGLRGFSLVSGEEDELARLHPLIGGVSGANTMGAAIVSFNLNAFESYGKVQSYNAPVGVQDAFRYTTALNRLLADSTRRARIGDATVVFWSDRPTQVEQLFAHIVDESSEDQATVDRVSAFFAAARQGRLPDAIDEPAAPFYIAGLSPNASRLNIRFWLAGTVQQFVERLIQHLKDLEMTGARDTDPPLMIRRLIYEAMPEGTAASRERQTAQLAGAFTRAVFTGGAYPQAIFSGIIRRIRADHTVNHRRAAMLKACIVRTARLAGRMEEVPVSLKEDHPDQAYQMGRLFAALEKTQQDALPGLNKTIKDGYFSTASATPASVFPRLMRLHQHHFEKLDGGRRVNRERLIQDICARIDRFQTHLSLEQQGMFHIGYYHQRQAFITSRKNGASTEEAESAIEEVTA